MFNTEILTLDSLSSIVRPIVDKHHVGKAVVFGSYARGTATPQSDIDMVVYGDDDFQGRSVFAIAEELYEASGKRVDVYERCEIQEGSPLLRAIEEEGVVL
ncbi:nucleotidyltransferase family protein [Gordonibacter sp.]|uniref:nucleotidyltransferase family protein n=1 Tax=Gordonibacter sp. TaxID=1968902 RepID=UPI002FC6532C